MAADLYELSIPEVPPSLNGMGFGGRNSHMKLHRLKKRWEGYFVITLLENKVPKALTRVRASARLRFRVKRRRDEGNFRWLLEKALGDALQANGNLDDDTADEFTFGTLTFEADRGQPRTTVTLEVWRD